MPVKFLIIFSIVLITCPAFTLAEEVFTTEQRVEIEWRIQQAIDARLGSSQLLDDGLQDTIERGILRFIERQAAERIKSQAASEATQAERASTVRPVSNQADHIFGSVTAPYSLIEYSDFNCGYCQRFHPTLQAFVEGSNGAVNWVYRHRPVLGTYLKAQAAECAARLAGNTAFWSYADWLFTEPGRAANQKVDLITYAQSLGLNEAAFDACLGQKATMDRIVADNSDGERIGIQGTPGSVLLHNESGQARLVSGAQPLEQLQQVLQALQLNLVEPVPGNDP